jgi:MFS family permease
LLPLSNYFVRRIKQYGYSSGAESSVFSRPTRSATQKNVVLGTEIVNNIGGPHRRARAGVFCYGPEGGYHLAEKPVTRLPFFYGWVIVALGLLGMASWTGIRTAFAVFYAALLDEFGWSRGGTAGVQSVSYIIYLILAPLTGGLIDRFGPRRVILPGLVIFCGGLALCGCINSLLQFYLFFGVVVAIGITSVSITAYSPILAQWFEKKRGLAVGFAVSGMGLGTFLLVPLTQYFISLWGWRMSFVALGVLIFIVLFPLTWIFIRHKPADLGLLPDGVVAGQAPKKGAVQVVDPVWAATDWTVKRIFRTGRYWALLIFAFLAMVPIYLMVTHSVRFLVDKGANRMAAAFFLALVGIVSLVFRIFWGWLSDRIGREPTFTMGALFISMAAWSLLFINATGKANLGYLFSLLLGIGWGVTAPMFIAASADLFQGKRFGLIYGILEAVIGAGCAFGAWFGGFIFDKTQSYQLAFILCGVLPLASGIVVWFAAPRKVRRVVRVTSD